MMRAALAVVAFAGAAASSGSDATGAMQLQARLVGTYHHTICPPGIQPLTGCFDNDAGGIVPGLGDVRETSTLLTDAPTEACRHWRSLDTLLTIPAKGRLRLTSAGSSCLTPCPCGRMLFTVTGGSGIYAGASGSGVVRVQADNGGALPRQVETWIGTLVVPGLTFDLTPPAITGASSRVVRAPRQARSARVRFAITATDAVDGSVAVGCLPRSDSRFPIGRTRVTCWADDSSGNRATRSFVVRVKR
jgi:hypothetical protein